MDANFVIHDVESISIAMLIFDNGKYSRTLTVCTADGAIIDIDLLADDRESLAALDGCVG